MITKTHVTSAFRVEDQLRYHWGADEEIMSIMNKRDKSPETSELVMRPHWNKNFGREIYARRRPEENERREIRRIDLHLKRKEREIRIGVGYFRDFGDEKPQRAKQDPAKREETKLENEPHRVAKSTISSYSEEAVATHKPGAYPAIRVQEYRDGPIEKIAVHYRLSEEKQKETSNKKTLDRPNWISCWI